MRQQATMKTSNAEGISSDDEKGEFIDWNFQQQQPKLGMLKA